MWASYLMHGDTLGSPGTDQKPSTPWASFLIWEECRLSAPEGLFWPHFFRPNIQFHRRTGNPVALIGPCAQIN